MSVNYYKSILKKVDWNEVVVVSIIACIVATLAILHVIVGLAQTLPGFTYMGTGHYYLDFFYYTVFIAQGNHGHWIAFQQFATDDASLYPQWFPYILIGQISKLFGLTPIAAYWVAVFMLSFALVFAIYLFLSMILKEEKVWVRISALIIALCMSPFFTGLFSSLSWTDYWSSYATFFRRFEPIPHHLLGWFVVLCAMIFISYVLGHIHRLPLKKIVLLSVGIGLMFSFTLLFYPFQVVVALVALGLSQTFYVYRVFHTKKYGQLISLLVLLGVVGTMSVVAAVVVRHLYSPSFIANFKQVETQIHANLSFKMFILTTGPAIILMLFGIRRFINTLNSSGIVILSFTFASFILFFSPVDKLLGTHNGRFLSPLTYVLWGAVAALGMRQFSSWFRSFSRGIFIATAVVFFLVSLPVHWQTFQNIINDRNINSPITYLKIGIVDAMEYVNRQEEKGNVLMTPSQFLGTILPIYTDRKTYVARHIATPNYIEKNITTSNFYLGAMSFSQARDLLEENGIDFVIWTSMEGYDISPLYTYPFLQEVYKNDDAVVFRLKKG